MTDDTPFDRQDMTPDERPETIHETEHPDRVVALVQAAQRGEGITEGLWCVPPYVVIVTPHTVRVTRDEPTTK